MYPASKAKIDDRSISFPFQKEDTLPKIKHRLQPLQSASEAVKGRIKTKIKTTSATGPSFDSPRTLGPIKVTPRRRHSLVVKMPSASYPRAVSPPSSGGPIRHAQQPNLSGNSATRSSALPPINVQATEETYINQQKKTKEESNVLEKCEREPRTLLVPDSTPDPKYESTDIQRRFSGTDKPVTNVHVTYRKPVSVSQRTELATPRQPVDYGCTNSTSETKPLRYANKYNSLYNSWETGLHSYHLHEEKDEGESLTFRLKIRPSDEETLRAKPPKTPPKDPFRETILSELEERRRSKIQEAVSLNRTKEVISGKPVVEDQPAAEHLAEMRNGSLGFHRIHQLNLAGDEYRNAAPPLKPVLLLDNSERASGLFVRKPESESVKRPFEQPSDNSPRLLTGKTVLRNPLSPVPLRHRYNPVVVLKSKLDDYTGAIKDFLEQVVEEQRMAAHTREPLPLSQSIDNMVIYKDFDTIEYFKAMQRQLKQSQMHTKDLQKGQQYNFKSPSSNVAKGVAKVKKLGAINKSESIEPLPKSGLRSKAIVGPQSVFLTNPQDSVQTPIAMERSAMQRVMMMNAGLGTPTSAPPNTPKLTNLC